MKRLTLLATILTSAIVYGGNGGGGGVPPALQDQMLLLMSSEQNISLMLDGQGNPILLSKKELPSTFTVDSNALISSEQPVTLSAGQVIDTVQTELLTKRSYVVTDGNELGSYELTSRREQARSNVNTSTLNQ